MPDTSEELDYSVLPDAPKIKTLRRAKGFTQESLVDSAKEKGLDISKRTVENAERGMRVMKSNLKIIAKMLAVEVEELIAIESEHMDFTQEMLEAIPLPVFFKDAKGVYRGCNQRFCDYLGRAREHIIGKTVFEVAPTAHAKIYKAKDDDLLEHPGEQIYQARVVADTVERRVIFFKGTFPVRGTPEGIIGVIVDITDYTSVTPERLEDE